MSKLFVYFQPFILKSKVVDGNGTEYHLSIKEMIDYIVTNCPENVYCYGNKNYFKGAVENKVLEGQKNKYNKVGTNFTYMS